MTAPSGWSFEDGSQSRTFDVTGTGDYTVRFRGYTNPTEEMAGFQVTYDSEHALLSETFTLPAVTAGAVNRVKTFSVPWLLYEDFSGVTTNSNYDNPAVGGTTIADGDGTAIDLSKLGSQNSGLDSSPRRHRSRKGLSASAPASKTRASRRTPTMHASIRPRSAR